MSEKFLNGQRTGELWDAVKNYVNGKGDAPAGSNVPPGGIIIWSGASNAVPEGWALCDGASGTPDLRGRFVLGNDPSHTIGSTGGSEEVTLTESQMPQHAHGFQAASQNPTGSMNLVFQKSSPSPAAVTGVFTSLEGGSKPHPNMPPYYVLCYIMKL